MKFCLLSGLLLVAAPPVLQAQVAVSAIDQSRLFQPAPAAPIPSVDADGNVLGETSNVDVWNLLVVPENSDEKLIYEITKTMFEKKDELVKVHKDASFLELANQMSGASPIPFHPGSLRYFREKGLKVN